MTKEREIIKEKEKDLMERHIGRQARSTIPLLVREIKGLTPDL